MRARYPIDGKFMMTDATQIERLLDAIQPIIDRHAETKEGSQLLHVPLRPHEMKELRSAFEPFRRQRTGLDHS